MNLITVFLSQNILNFIITFYNENYYINLIFTLINNNFFIFNYIILGLPLLGILINFRKIIISLCALRSAYKGNNYKDLKNSGFLNNGSSGSNSSSGSNNSSGSNSSSGSKKS